VLTGSINQAAVEADTSPAVRSMLVQAQQADVTMAPSADMFELGAKVQVLKRGTMFAMRASRLYDTYRNHSCYDDVPGDLRKVIERDMLRAGFEDAWQATREFFEKRDPGQIAKAEADPRHKMALVFRSYLRLASLWARGSCLEGLEDRLTTHMGMNLMCGAAYLLRGQWLRNQKVALSPAVTTFRPLTPEKIKGCLG